MNPQSILHPLFAQVTLIFVVWITMYYTRLTTMARDRVPVQDLADDAKFDAALGKVKNPSDNLENQYELPMLFAFAILVMWQSSIADELDLRLAWTFVISRMAHAFIHCTYNRIKHRFVAYIVGAIALWWLWARIILHFTVGK